MSKIGVSILTCRSFRRVGSGMFLARLRQWVLCRGLTQYLISQQHLHQLINWSRLMISYGGFLLRSSAAILVTSAVGIAPVPQVVSSLADSAIFGGVHTPHESARITAQIPIVAQIGRVISLLFMPYGPLRKTSRFAFIQTGLAVALCLPRLSGLYFLIGANLLRHGFACLQFFSLVAHMLRQQHATINRSLLPFWVSGVSSYPVAR